MSDSVPPLRSARRDRRARRGRRARPLVALAVLLAVAGYVVAQYVTGGPGAPHCTVGDGSGSYELTPEQAANAATISAVGTTRGLPERAVTIALATAMQESGLRNLGHGDRDSLGLFQQRPSQGWGTERQITDPVFSAGKFYDHLAEVPGYSRLPLTVAAQRVQRSGFPQAYAKHEPDATLLSAALTGRSAASLSCVTGGAPTTPGDPAKVRRELVRSFGTGVLPDRGTSAGTAGAAGAEPWKIALPVAAVGAAGPGDASGSPDGGSRRGWELAQWAVARASELGLAEVRYADRVWTARDGSDGWRAADGPAADEVRLTVAR